MCVAKSNRSHADLTRQAKEPVTLFAKTYSQTRIGLPHNSGQWQQFNFITRYKSFELNNFSFLPFRCCCLPRKSYKILWLHNESSKREKDIKYNGLGACRLREVANDLKPSCCAVADILLWLLLKGSEEFRLKYGANSLVTFDGCFFPWEDVKI